MSKTKLLVGAVAVAVAAGLAWHFSGNKDATSTVGSAVEQVVNPRAALETKSAELVKNFEAYLEGTEQAGFYQWESVTTLDDGTARLNNVLYKAPNTTEQEAIKIKYFDLQKMTYTPELYEQKVSFEGMSNVEGKSLLQEAFSDDPTFADLGYTGDWPLMDGEAELKHDVKNNTAAMSLFIKQADFLNMKVSFAGTQLNDFLDVITKTSEKEFEENPMKIMSALAPAFIEKLSIGFEDTGIVTRAQKAAPEERKLDPQECQFALMMAGISLEESACINVTNFLNGQQKQVTVSINPAQPVAIGKMMMDLASPTPEAIAAIVKELNVKIEN